jgi:hypothetical protein
MKYICINGIYGGRFGNCMFRYLASRLFIILYKLEIVEDTQEPTLLLTDNKFNLWKEWLLDHEVLLPFNDINTIIFNNFYHDALIYRKYKNEILEYMKNNNEEYLLTEYNEIYYIKDLLLEPPNLEYYNIAVHLRIEDYLKIGLAIHPSSYDNILKDYAEPILFIHKKEEDKYDIKYINYFKKKYPNSIFFCGNVIDCYNIMRTSKILVCSNSTMSWVAALLSITLEKVYVPKNINKEIHESFEYPIDNTILYDYNKIKYVDILNL